METIGTRWEETIGHAFQRGYRRRFHYLDRQQLQQLAGICSTVRDRRGHVLLVGPGGTGKTILLKRIGEECRAHDVFTIRYLAPPESARSLIGSLMRQLAPGMAVREQHKPVITLVQDALSALQAQQRVLICVDEAQAASDEVLSTLFRIADSGNAAIHVPLVLAGTEGLERRLRRLLPAAQLTAIDTTLYLRPLAPDQVAAYIEHQLVAAGLDDARVFPPAVIEQITTLSGGVPGEISSLCSMALYMAHLEGSPAVSGEIVQQLSRDCWIVPVGRTTDVDVTAGATRDERRGTRDAPPAGSPWMTQAESPPAPSKRPWGWAAVAMTLATGSMSYVFRHEPHGINSADFVVSAPGQAPSILGPPSVPAVSAVSAPAAVSPPPSAQPPVSPPAVRAVGPPAHADATGPASPFSAAADNDEPFAPADDWLASLAADPDADLLLLLPAPAAGVRDLIARSATVPAVPRTGDSLLRNGEPDEATMAAGRPHGQDRPATAQAMAEPAVAEDVQPLPLAAAANGRLTGQATVRTRPSVRAPVLRTLAAGDPVAVDGRAAEPGWYRVVEPHGDIGYLFVDLAPATADGGYRVVPQDEKRAVALEVPGLLQRAAGHLAADRLLAPRFDNALYLYREVLRIDPANAEADEGIRRIKAKLVSHAERARSRDDPAAARHALAKVLLIDPADRQALGLVERLRETPDQAAEDRTRTPTGGTR